MILQLKFYILTLSSFHVGKFTKTKCSQPLSNKSYYNKLVQAISKR